MDAKKAPEDKTDRELAEDLLSLRSHYAMQEDGDGARLGKDFFETVGRMMKEHVSEIFNRAAGGMEEHRELDPVLEKLVPLDSAARTDVGQIFDAIYNLRLPQKPKAVEVNQAALRAQARPTRFRAG